MAPKPTRKTIVTTNRISFRFTFPPHFLFFQNSHCVQNSNYGNAYITKYSFPHSRNTKSAKNQEHTFNPKSNHYILHDNLFCRFCYFNRVHQLRRFICHQNYICCFNGRIRTKPTHCNTNICTGKDRSVIDTITNKSK